MQSQDIIDTELTYIETVCKRRIELFITSTIYDVYENIDGSLIAFEFDITYDYYERDENNKLIKDDTVDYYEIYVYDATPSNNTIEYVDNYEDLPGSHSRFYIYSDASDNTTYSNDCKYEFELSNTYLATVNHNKFLFWTIDTYSFELI